MRAGTLRHRITVQQLVANSPSQNAGGEPDESWTAVATRWASVDPLKGRELIAAQQVNSEVTGTIRMRHLAGATSKMRCVFGSRNYDVLAVVNPDERNRETVLYVRELTNNG